MSYRAATDLCRLSVVTPNNVVELALPASVALVDLLPAVLSFGGRDLADRGLAHDGWVLQRLGGPPLPEARTLDEIGVYDGETLYLRPRQEKAREAVFDDLVDGLATAVREREDRLRSVAARWAGPVSGGVLLLAGVAAVAASAERLRPVAAGIAVLLLLVASAMAGRVSGARPAAVVLGLGTGIYAGAGAVFAVGVVSGPPSTHGPTALLWGGAAALVALAIACAAAGAGPEVFLSAGVVALGATVAGTVAVAVRLTVAQAAGLVAVLGIGFVLAVPRLSFRLAGERLPALPSTAADIQREEQPNSQRHLWRISGSVDRLMAAFLTATGVLAVAGAALCAGAHGAAPYLAADTGVALLLRARVFVRTALKVLLQGAGVLALAATVWRLAAAQPAAHAPAIAAATVVLGIAAAAVAPRGDGDRPPYAARAADLFEYVAVGALVPLALAVAGAFGWARGLG